MIQQAKSPKYYQVPIRGAVVPTPNRRSVYWTADSAGIRLRGSKHGYLSPDSIDGSLGRLRLPQGFAIDALLRCFFVQPSTGIVWMFDSYDLPHNLARPFKPILNLGSQQISTNPAEKLALQWSLAANSRFLFIVNPEANEVLCIALNNWSTQSRTSFGNNEKPLEVVASCENVHLLTTRAMYVFDGINQDWIQIAEVDATNILVTREGQPIVYSSIFNTFRAYSTTRGGGEWRTVQIDRTEFVVPPVYATFVDPKKPEQGILYVIPPELNCVCNRALPKSSANTPPEFQFIEITPEMQVGDLSNGFVAMGDCVLENLPSYTFEKRYRVGERVTTHPSQFPRKRFLMTGTEDEADQGQSYWVSQRVDSKHYKHHWDRILFELTQLPVGATVEISTTTSDDEDFQGLSLLSTQWDAGIKLVGKVELKQGQPLESDFLVRSRPGQFLWLRIRLNGDGFSSPVVHQLLARGPRQSYVDFLPAVMLEDDASRDFLERFLSVFQTDWDALDSQIDRLYQLFDPNTAEAGQLPRLAKMFGVEFPQHWNAVQQRALLRGLSSFIIAKPDKQNGLEAGSIRGTPAHLKQMLQAVLAALTGLTEEQMRGFPWIIEGFRERESNPVGTARTSDRRLKLAGINDSNRIQLGDDSVLGKRQLLPPQRMELDVYTHHAFRFRVVVPESWVAERGALATIKSMIESEKPAHCQGEVTLVRPGLRIGIQSTVGVDTILADRPIPTLTAERPPTLGISFGMVLPDRKTDVPAVEVGKPITTHQI